MKKFMKMLPLVAVLMAATGCIVNSQYIDPTGNDAVEVLLRLRTPDKFSDRSTRALDAESENAIHDIHVLVFDRDDVLTSVEVGTLVTGGPLASPTTQFSGEGKFEVTLPASKSGEEYKLVVLANLASIAGMTGDEGTLAGLEGESYDEVVEALSVAITGKLYTGAAPSKGFSIPMWGETDYVVIDQSLVIQSVNLTRAVARIDVGVGRPDEAGTSWDGKKAGGATIPFTLTEVYVMRPGNRYAILPDPDNYGDGKPTIVGSSDPDVVSFSATDSKTKFGYTTTQNGFTTREIYIPEANIIQGGTPGDARHEKRMALVVGGTYQSATHYYRIDFIDGDSKGLIDVLRNHLYQFNIADVVGPGSETPELAYANPSMNIEVKIVNWTTEVFEDVKIVRDRYFSLSRRSPFELSSLAGESETLTIETNIENFTMTLASPALTLSSGTGGMVTSTNFKYTLAGSGGVYTLTIETLNDNLGGSQRTPSDTWAIDANGIIEFDYTVRQAWSLYSPTPHNITLTSDAGGTTATTHGEAPQGTPVTVIARPEEGYVFTGWTLISGPGGFTLPSDQTANPEMPFTMPGGAITIKAGFAPVPTITIDPAETLLSFAARNATGSSFTVSSNYSAEVTVGGSGFTINDGIAKIDVAAGTSKTITVGASDFTEDSQRTGRITIRSTAGTPQKTITIDLVQTAFVPTLTITPQEALAPGVGKVWKPNESGDGKKLTVTVAANTKWEVISIDGYTITPIGNTGTTGGSFTITPGANNIVTTGVDKTGTVTVRTTAGTPQVIHTFPVRQQAPRIILNPVDMSPFPASGYSIRPYTVTSNIPWTSTITGTDFIRTDATGHGTVGTTGTFTIIPAGSNIGPNERNATVSIKGSESDFTDIGYTFAVTQFGTGPSIVPSNSSLTFAAAGSDRSFTVASNLGWSAVLIGPGFTFTNGTTTSSITGGTDGRTITVRATATTGDQRTGKITITGANGTTIATVDLIQTAFTPTLSIDKPEGKVWTPTQAGRTDTSIPLAVSVTTNSPWKITPPIGFTVRNATVGTDHTTAFTGTGNVNIQVYPTATNATATAKSGMVRVETNGVTPAVVLTFPVEQQAPRIELTPGSLAAWAATDGTTTKTVTIVSNIPWKLTNSSITNFSTPTATSGGVTEGTNFSVKPADTNSTSGVRTATITVEGTATGFTGFKKTLEVTQLSTVTPTTYPVSVTASPADGGNTAVVTDTSGGALIDGRQTPGAGVRFTASPGADYTFSGWSVTKGSTPYGFSAAAPSPLDVAMTAGELGLTATFTRRLWKITGVTQPTGVTLTRGTNASTAEGTGVPSGTAISYTVAASSEDYNVPTITASGSGINQTSNTGVSFSMPVGSVEVKITAGSLKTKYTVSTVTAPAGVGATITATMGGSNITLPTTQLPGKEIVLTAPATDPASYLFTGWSLSGNGFYIKGGTSQSSTSKTITVVVSSSANGTATANYEKMYTLAPSITSTSGTVSGSTISKDPNVTYHRTTDNVTVSLTSTQTTGHKLVGWELTNATRQSGSLLTGAVTGSITVRVTANATVKAVFEPLAPPQTFTPGSNDIIYIENPGTTNAKLAIGKWGDGKVTNINIARFKFGSLVGTYNPLGSGTDAFNPGDIGFNPIPTGNVTITGTESTGWGQIPYYRTTLGAGDGWTGSASTSPEVSSAGYHNDANLKFGKGDPCRLIGLSAADAQTMATNNTLDSYNSGWRLPTALENYGFIGYSPVPSNPSSGDYYRHASGTNGPHAYWTAGPQVGSVTWNGGYFPVLAGTSTTINTSGTFLPAAGSRHRSSGAVAETSSLGYYWSSTPSSESNVLYLNLNSSRVGPAAGESYTNGFTVRCVPAQ